MLFRWKNDPERHAEGVVPPPRDPNAPGEMGKAVKLDNPEPETKKLIDDGWKNNAFNQYASDIISLHRSMDMLAPTDIAQTCCVGLGASNKHDI